MKLTFLGTSAGLPTRERNVSSLALAMDDNKRWYMVDCGEATQHQLLRCRYTLKHLKAIFITHLHGDHIFGLPGLLSSAAMSGRTELLTICAPSGLESFIQVALGCGEKYEMPFEIR